MSDAKHPPHGETPGRSSGRLIDFPGGGRGSRHLPEKNLPLQLTSFVGREREMAEEEGCAALADALLRTCPKLQILATSREALGISGESAWLVPPLVLPEAGQEPPIEELTRYEAIRMFIERARATASTFELTEQNAPAIARLCQRLEGMPLAIELAAPRVKVLSVEQISSRLEDSFGLLTGGSRTTMPHQRKS